MIVYYSRITAELKLQHVADLADAERFRHSPLDAAIAKVEGHHQ